MYYPVQNLIDQVLKKTTNKYLMYFVYFRGQYLFKPKPGETPKDNKFYRRLYPQIIQDIDVSETIFI